MNDLSRVFADLPELSAVQIAALPHEQLQALDLSLNALMKWVKQAHDQMNAALEQRYGEPGRAALLASGRDFGVTHLDDGPLRVTYELPKRVTWDQSKLAALAEKIVTAGEDVKDYLDIELSVSESRYKSWQPALKVQFADARTVKAGKPSFRLALTAGGER